MMQHVFMSLVLFAILATGPSSAGDLPSREGYLPINGVDHFFREIGDGEPFVVLHGGPGMFHDELYPFFLDFARTHRVIFYDQRGNGRSRMSAVDSTTFNVALLVDDLDQLRQAFGLEKLNLIGHSWGGLLAMYYAVQHPERVRRLITVSAAPASVELLIMCYENQVSRYTDAEWTDLQAIWESEGYLAGDPAVHNRAMRMAETVLFVDEDNAERYFAAAAFDSATARAAVALADLVRGIKLGIHIESELPRITCPTLIVHSRQDFIVPEAPRLAAKLIPDAELTVLEGSGHYPHIEVPDALFAAIEDFVARTAGVNH